MKHNDFLSRTKFATILMMQLAESGNG